MRNAVALSSIGVLAVLAIVVGVWRMGTGPALPSPVVSGATTTPSLLNTISTPLITFAYPSAYVLATTPVQVLAKAYIPPCGTPFDYCLYRVGKEYMGTNFESAGLRLQKRTDLTTRNACATTSPAGYTSMVSKRYSSSSYTTSLFAPLGNAGAGHYTSGALYRLFVANTCYEFETRIGETQFLNYPAGSIRKFTDANRASVASELTHMLQSITIASSTTTVVFPTP